MYENHLEAEQFLKDKVLQNYRNNNFKINYRNINLPNFSFFLSGSTGSTEIEINIIILYDALHYTVLHYTSLNVRCEFCQKARTGLSKIFGKFWKD